MRNLVAIGVLVAGLWLASKGLGAALVVALLVALLLSSKAAPALGARRITVHTHGGHGTRTAARHEAGHVLMAKRLGARVHSAHIYPDGSGVTELTIPRNLTVAQQVAIDVSGEVAAGTKAGCESDQAYMQQALASLPRSERAAAKRAGYALARCTVGGWLFDGGVSSTAARLMKTGSL